MSIKRLIAKAIWFGCGQLCRIRIYQHTYSLKIDPMDIDPENWPPPRDEMWEKNPRSWIIWARPIRWGYKAEKWDPEHFEHWSLDHSGHTAEPCDDCGGERCLVREDSRNEGLKGF